MYMNIRVGLRRGKVGRPPLRLCVTRLTAQKESERSVSIGFAGTNLKPWRVRAMVAIDELCDLERRVSAYALALGPERERSPSRTTGRVAVEGPKYTLRVNQARPNNKQRLYPDGLCLHRQGDSVIARWFEGDTCFEILGDDAGWVEFFAGLRTWLGPDLGANPSTTSPCTDADKRAHACVTHPTVTVSGVTVPA